MSKVQVSSVQISEVFCTLHKRVLRCCGGYKGGSGVNLLPQSQSLEGNLPSVRSPALPASLQGICSKTPWMPEIADSIKPYSKYYDFSYTYIPILEFNL